MGGVGGSSIAVTFLCCNAGEYTASVSHLMWMHE
jgi:hypothetical protein